MATGADETTEESNETRIHRLRDIVVEEVSLVDRAANKRRFLIVKRNSMAKRRQSQNAAGDASTESAKAGKGKPPPRAARRGAARRGRAAASDMDPDEDEDDDEDEEAEKADDDDDDEEAEKANDDDDDEEAKKSDDDDDDEEAKKADDDDDDEDSEKAAGDEDDEEDGKKPKGKPWQKAKAASAQIVLTPTMKSSALRVLTKALERLMTLANRINKAASPAAGAQASVPQDLVDEIDQIGALLQDANGQLPTTKGGARMARNRLDRFKTALHSLSDLLLELTNPQEPTTPSAGAAEATRKRAPKDGLAELMAGMGDLTQLVKQQGDDISQLRKARGTSNAIPVDGPRRERRSADVSWPLDMNRPISRDSVAKAISFYDDTD